VLSLLPARQGRESVGLGETWRCLSLDPLARRAAAEDEVR
jgi:hypothetical protein